MAYIRNYMDPYNNNQEKLKEALSLIKSSVSGEKEDEMFYDYLISLAPTDKQKDIIITIRDDERKHNKMFRNIYKDITGKDVVIEKEEKFVEPKSYIAGVEKALFGELSAVEKYRKIMADLPYTMYRDMVFEIITDEIKHAIKYNYILYLNCCKNNKKNIICKDEKKPKKKREERNRELKKRIDKFGENITVASNNMILRAKQKVKEERIVEDIIVPGLVLGIKNSYVGVDKEKQDKFKVDMKQELLVNYVGEVVGIAMDKVREKVDLDKFVEEYVIPNLIK
ncbi:MULTISPECIES: ferritin-like domain-containing protein [Clostridium]|uniref:ferritin-like domain-containing protein n=1 Tax=Clostridium TaxID=1485 RepID=UPI0004D4D7A2|nr:MULTISPECIES: ferritin-like domain-containing protein [Clostridium]KEH88738.1 rubrerythrin [Clostridium novyi A str. 4540]KEH94362.1 rubrerythrin [Clostridium botulinum C/D str. It1]KEH95059.1 rubrerythrin [Clostridium novyi A str. GD211209]